MAFEVKFHDDKTFGLGASKAQHFIEHIRQVDMDEPDWREQQEAFAEHAQMAVCEELVCPVCKDTCKTMTTKHWDENRIMHGDPPKNQDYAKLHKAIDTVIKAKGYLIE